MTKLLVTGASGGVARMLRPLLRARFGPLILSDLAAPGDLADDEEFRAADLADRDAVLAAMEGATAAIHLGGKSIEGAWDVVHRANIAGCQTFFDCALESGIGRVVFASSIHAIGFYGRDRTLTGSEPVRPDSFYGVSKVFGEALASLYADKHGMRCLSIRIGNVDYKPVDRRRLAIWLHPEDLLQLCEIGLTHADIHNQVVWGVSGNRHDWWDNGLAYGLGYRPKHRSEDHEAEVLAREERADPVGDLFQGGVFCSDGFDGDLERVRRQ
jgi:uronate dehydrogenase